MENHKGAHYTLTIFLDGRIILTTPDTVPREAIPDMAATVQRWLNSKDRYPLIIGNCMVHIVQMAVQEATVEGG